MRELELSKGYKAQVDDEDYERCLEGGKWNASVSPKKNTVYAVRTRWISSEKRYTHDRLHRFILGVTDPKVEVDHKDRNGLNCQRYNLRPATRSQSQRNKGNQINNTSGFKGVCWDKSKNAWKAYVSRKHIGHFATAEEAAKAHDIAVLKLHGEFAVTNKSLGAIA